MKNIKKTYSNIKNKNFKINEEETYIVRMLNEVLEIKQQRTYTSEEFWKKIQNDYFDTLNKDTNETVSFGKLGKFKVKTVPERRGKIMMGDRKGEEYVTPQHEEICFKMSKSAKQL